MDPKKYRLTYKLADLMCAITEEKQTPDDTIWVYSYMTALEQIESWTSKDWAYLIKDGAAPATIDHVEEWLRDWEDRLKEEVLTEDKAWDEMAQAIENRMFN